MSDPNLAPEGYHAGRLRPEAENPREVAFSEQWAKENESTDIVRHLICLEADTRPNAISLWPGTPMREVRSVSDEERKAVATVIQWLGSNIGFCFLQEALHRCGYGIRKESR